MDIYSKNLENLEDLKVLKLKCNLLKKRLEECRKENFENQVNYCNKFYLANKNCLDIYSFISKSI